MHGLRIFTLFTPNKFMMFRLSAVVLIPVVGIYRTVASRFFALITTTLQETFGEKTNCNNAARTSVKIKHLEFSLSTVVLNGNGSTRKTMAS